MKAEKIQQIIEDYASLENHTMSVIDKLEKLDGEIYNTKRCINQITYDEKEVCVECDDNFYSCYDDYFFSFPISFLSMSDEELKQGVLAEKQRREEEERLKEEKIELEEKKRKELQERLQYERLKKKFENK